MVRATAARVLVRLGGTYPTGFAEAAITSMCTQADYILDRLTHNVTLSTSDNEVVEIAVDIVLNMMAEASWFQAGGFLSGRQKPDVVTPLIQECIARWMSRDYGPQAVDMMDTET